jgi:phospholipid/cholesterol/gamma-HCH transport system substrate-binding protein
VIRQIKKQLPVFVAIICLLVGALAVTTYLLSQQRFYLPAWVPLIGTDFYEVKAELPTAQAVVPGQGQSVNIAGVKIGEVGDVQLENGRAVVTMQIQDKHKPIYRDANVLMRPKTGLKDMYLALDPGTKVAGELPEGGRVKVANTLPDVNADEVLAQLDADTRAYLEILLSAGGTAFDDKATGADAEFQQTAEQDLREALKRFEPTARYGDQITSQLISRRHNITRVIHNFQELSTALGRRDDQLAAFVDSANKNFESLAAEESSLRAALREFPGALSQTTTTLTKTEKLAAQLGPALERLRPFARELAPALRSTRPFLRDTTPIIRDQIRPFARDVQPTVRDLRTAAQKLAPATPRLARSFGVLNEFFNTLAYDPPGATQSFLFWSAWSAHNGATLWSQQDAHGPVRRGIVFVGCQTYGSLLNAVLPGSPQLGTAVQLLNLPDIRTACPQVTVIGAPVKATNP